MKIDGGREINVQHTVHETYTKGVPMMKYSMLGILEIILPKGKIGDQLLFKKVLSLQFSTSEENN